MRTFFIATLMGVFILANSAFAGCSNPGGKKGDTYFNKKSGTLQLCNGSRWINAGNISPGVMTPANNELACLVQPQNMSTL